MGPPWMPLHVGDYLADTGHLTAEQHGAYMLLIMHYWRNGKLPANEQQKASIARLSLASWRKNLQIIQGFFTCDREGNWFHGRIEKELERAGRKQAYRKEAGRLGGLKKQENFLANAKANATALPKQTPTILEPRSYKEEERKKDSCAVAVATRPDYSSAVNEFWKEYPKRDGANPKTPAIKKLICALKSGVPLEAIISGTKRYRSECADKKIIGTAYVAQAVTWLNQQRWGDYQPQAPPPSKEPKPPSPLDLELIAEYRNGHGRIREDHQQDRKSESSGMDPDGFRSWPEDG